MAKNLHEGVLLDFYGELLTDKQKRALELYYNEDLSLAEIAEDMHVSRQGVRAFIKQGEAHLAEFEEKLGMFERFSSISRLSKEAKTIAKEFPESKEKLIKIIEEIEKHLQGR
ncbi:MAG: DNA-binding protein [Firmicutes bacterium]|nr:DNA-binding protein [Bacillota bacterium]